MEREQQAGGTEPEGPGATAYRLPAVAWAVEAEEQSAPGGPQTDPDASTVVRPTVPAMASGTSGTSGTGTTSTSRTGTASETAEAPETETPENAETPETAEEFRGGVPEASPGAGAEAAEETGALPQEERHEAVAGRQGRISRPMIAAAAMAGVVLVGLSLGLSQIGGGGPHHDPPAPPPAGFSQQSGGGNGFVPGLDDHAGSLDRAAGAAPGLLGPTPSPTTSPSAGGPPGDPRARPVSRRTPQPAAARRTTRSGGGTPQPVPWPTAPAGTAPRPAPATTAPAPATFQAVAGPWCSNRGAGFSTYNWFTDGLEGWTVSGTGGWTGDNCSGKYVAMPMSGDAHQDMDSSTVWTFTTGAVSRGTCRISVYIPANGDTTVVGGKPAYYTVQNQFAPGSGTIGSFSIDQTANRGRWVGAGAFPVTGGRIAVMLHDRGLDWSGTTRTYAHHAAAPVRMNCTA